MAGKNNTKKNTQAEQESGKIYLAGTITTAMFGKRTFANGKSDKEEKYRLSMKLTAETMEKLKNPETLSNPEKMQAAMEDFKFLKETQRALNDVLKGYGFGNVALNI